ncbi:ParA family protein [uncultured Fusobacterium sp.]|jgi:chromosome partitioning protein|uniref:ParA family protein n=1 Tax=uncultured Fusobacterium sp. TaxID=159267 RepID=UPI0015A68455|nr:ParA family protein [uncultured Fusobacterium sp.]
MKKNVVINYKSDGRLNFGRINLSKNFNNILKISSDNNQVFLEFLNNELTIKPTISGVVEQITKVEDNLVSMRSLVKLSYDKTKDSFKFLIPLPIVKKWNLEKNKVVDVIPYDDKVVFKQYKEEEKITMTKDLIPIFAFKVVKGGVGKTFFATQTAAGLGEAGIKVLFLTLDSQNDALDMLLPADIIENKRTQKNEKVYTTYDKDNFKLNRNTKGLKYWMKYGKGNLIKVRENIDYIPLESPFNATPKTKEEFEEFLLSVRKNHNYDCIVIDSPPTEKIDQIILQQANKLIIPAYADKFTVKGIVTVIDEVGADKVAAILFNRYDDTVVEKEYYQSVKEILKGTNVYCPDPIKKLSAITQLLDRSKTIWESEDKRILSVQEKITELLKILFLEIE